jgi:hypothetical protein
MIVEDTTLTLPVSASARPPAASEQREQPRSSMFLACILRTASGQVPVRIRNMSPSGALVEAPMAALVSTPVQLIRGSLQVRATVTWASGHRCGLRFASEVVVAAWLKAAGPTHQGRVDRIVTQIKAGTARALSQPSSPESRPRAADSPPQLLDDLHLVHRLLAALEDELTSEPATLARHGLELHNLDIGMQMIRAIAADLTTAGNRSKEDSRRDNLRVACHQVLSQS